MVRMLELPINTNHIHIKLCNVIIFVTLFELVNSSAKLLLDLAFMTFLSQEIYSQHL